MKNERRVAIIGGGIAGSIAAIRLIQQASSPFAIDIFDGRAAFREGVGYTSESNGLFLNVPCFHMGIYAEDPNDFRKWMADGGSELNFGPYTFCLRSDFSRYLKARWSESIKLAQEKRITVVEHFESVDDILEMSDGLRISTSSGRAHVADVCLVATGPIPTIPKFARELEGLPKFNRSIFELANEELGSNESVAIIGTGLSMVDALSILKSKGHCGSIVALSRRGLLPTSHSMSDYPVQVRDLSLPETVRLSQLLRWVRGEAKKGNWKSVMQALRPLTPQLWRRLSLAERSRFLRHMKPFWDVHRHRMAPWTDEVVEQFKRSGRLKIISGKVNCVERDGGAFRVKYRVRGKNEISDTKVDRLVLSTGFENGIKDLDHIVHRLVGRGLALVNPLGLGIQTDPSGRCENERVFAVGWPRLGQDFETTAVPEIRSQVELAIKGILLLLNSTSKNHFISERMDFS